MENDKVFEDKAREYLYSCKGEFDGDYDICQVVKNSYIDGCKFGSEWQREQLQEKITSLEESHFINFAMLNKAVDTVKELQQENATLKAKLDEATNLLEGVMWYGEDTYQNECPFKEIKQFLSSCNVNVVDHDMEVVKTCINCGNNKWETEGFCKYATSKKCTNKLHEWWIPEPKKVVTKEGI